MKIDNILNVITSDALDNFLEFLKKEYALDYSGYSQAFVMRRVAGFLEQRNINNLDILEKLFLQRPELVKDLEQELSINYTEMFRNPPFFDSLRKHVFPFLSTYPTLKIWHAGCSTGEEIYSLAILLDEVGLLGRSKIYASDINHNALEKASKGIFDTTRMKEFTSNYHKAGGKKDFSNYYSSGYGQLKFQENLRKRVTFQQHNLISDPCIDRFNLVLCRNVMIYFNSELQNGVVGLLRDSLCNLGYLGLGATETLSFNQHKSEFAVIDKNEKIYRKVSLSEWTKCKN
ncbi:MAG: protein-glutamate O-methyltransferase CheR [Bacteroidia bacterium]|nr:protein-glutamate O-methyltransferase CheR [Bacteroidia bacterium]